MNSLCTKVLFALVMAATSVVGLSSAALSQVPPNIQPNAAGEGGMAGGAAFSIDATTGNVTGVAVSASVGKEAATAGAFNYEAGSGVANSAFAIGTAGTTDLDAVGDPAAFSVTTFEDTDRGTAQANGFSDGFNVQIGTESGDDLITSPAP